MLGSQMEQLAAQFLQEKGYRILGKNFYSPFGELDLIAEDGEVLVFCEVKYRKDTRYGYPVEAVCTKKLHRMRKTAQYYCMCNHISADRPKRFDVVGILGDTITLYQNIELYL